MLSFWLKNIAIAGWIVVSAVVLGRAVRRERDEASVGA
ncbi:putative membrane protein [Mycobacterium kansasii 732]|nr:putative membrane protein [Mycobacterium kansasii 732]